MNGDEVVRRLLAYEAGRPLPVGATIHFPIASGDDLLLLSFVKMGGESAPWGIAWAREQGATTVLTIPEPRNRDAVAGMLEQFTPTLLKHIGHPALVDHAADSSLRQIWLPNATHVEMLHHLAYTYTFTRFGSAERAAMLNALGRASGWLFRESQRPGEVMVMDASAALRESFTFPTESIRQHHLGFLLAWLQTRGGGRARGAAAREAEQKAIATSLDPSLERDELQERVEAYNDAHRAKNPRGERREAKRIEELLARELNRRIDLVRQAITVLRSDRRRENAGVKLLVDSARSEHEYQYARIERRLAGMEEGPVFIPSPETDRHPAAAAVGFFRHEESADLIQQALIHDDVELQAAAVAAGDALRGTITKVADEGTGRATTPVWTIKSTDATPLRIRAGTELCVAGLRRRTAKVRSISGEAGMRVFTVEIINLKRSAIENEVSVPAAADPSLRGVKITLVPTFGTGISMLKRRKVWDRGGPGAWLTHAPPPPRHVPDSGSDDGVITSMLGDRK